MARNVPVRDRQHRAGGRRPQALTELLADFAHRLHRQTLAELEDARSAHLAALYQQAREEITSDLTHDAFADLLAQTLVYCCLRICRTSQEGCAELEQTLHAFLALPGLPPFARRLLTTFWQDAEAVESTLATCVGDLLALLMATDIQALLEKLRPASLQSDPLIYFYELFLTAYAPRQRSRHGVYYTPAPVIVYIVKSIDCILRDAFACAGGFVGALRDQQPEGGIWLCDPACGTGAFLWTTLDYLRQVYYSAGLAAEWQSDLPVSILPRLTGCEIMPTAYLLACIELAARQRVPNEGIQRTATGANDASPHISLTNTLVDTLPLAVGLPIILGNPPYAGHSLNHSHWLSDLLESYKAGDAGLKKRAQSKWLSDDYVQFLRLAQWQVERAGRGIVAFLTSHSYLDNPTFRGMRLSLLRSFDDIYILDLHGNSKRRELTPDGMRDRNIFTIQQGVAIGIFVKRDSDRESTGREASCAEQDHNQQSADLRTADERPESLATVRYADVWGSKAVYTANESGTQQLSGGKLGWLANHDLSNTPWQTSHPVAPFYLFTPRNDNYQAEYMANWSLPAIFALNGDPAPGLVTCHDEFAISWTAEEAAAKIAALLATSEEAEARSLFRLCTQEQWNYATARRELANGTWRNALGRVHYRPFDTRWTVFERHVAVHLRARVTHHMRTGHNLALAVGRAGQVINGGDNWDVVFCSRLPTEFNLYRRGGNYLLPLYLYPPAAGTRMANLAPSFSTDLSQRLALQWLPDGPGDLDKTFGPDDIFAYIYALLYAPGYRARYASFLKIDFPRIPLPTRVDLFRALCISGYTLIQAHLLEQPLSGNAAWSQTESSPVEYVYYLANDHESGRVCINPRQYLDGVPSAAWELTIGGYQVAKRWLSDRRGRQLSSDELKHYSQIIASLVRTLDLMKAIDGTIEQHGGWPL